MAPIQAALSAGITGVVFGLALGTAQWLALRARCGFSAWWPAASGLGWLVALGLAAAVAEPLTVLGALLLAGAAAGEITGSVLQRWLGRAHTGQE